MDVSMTRCANCGSMMEIVRVRCEGCDITMDGKFERSPLARLSLADQAFVVAFLRHHGSLKKMEHLFDISYPTVKNRVNAINAQLDRSFEAPPPNSVILGQLARGEITVNEAIERLG